MKVYIAAPLFSEGERSFNEKVDAIVRECGHETFLPQREGGCVADLPAEIDGMPVKVLVNSISRGVRRWLMANPGSDPRFVENRIDVCPKKHLSVQCQTGAVRCLQLRFK